MLYQMSKTLYLLLSTGSIQEDRKSSRYDCKIDVWDVEHPSKQFQLELSITCACNVSVGFLSITLYIIKPL